MDLTNQPVINTEIQEDSETGLTTVIVKDSADTTTLGTIIIESSKLRALMTSLRFMAKALYPDTASVFDAVTNFKINDKKGSTEFL